MTWQGHKIRRNNTWKTLSEIRDGRIMCKFMIKNQWVARMWPWPIQLRIHWQAFVNTVVNIWVQRAVGYFEICTPFLQHNVRLLGDWLFSMEFVLAAEVIYSAFRKSLCTYATVLHRFGCRYRSCRWSVSLYSKQWLKCNTSKVCNCLIQFLLTMVHEKWIQHV
jgi:hypothetical protein